MKTLGVKWVVTVLMLGLWMSTPVAALPNTYRVGIDVDNESSTGCTFSLGSVPPGSLAGFELQVTVVVDDDDPIPAQVVSANVETCDGGCDDGNSNTTDVCANGVCQ